MTLILVFFLGIVTGFVDSTIGSSGLISIPALVFLGLPMQVAIATDRLGTIGQEIASFFKFHQAKQILWKYVPILSATCLIAGYIGANLLLELNADILEKIIGVLLILLLPLIFMKKNIGVERVKTSRPKKILGLMLFFGLMIFQGFFGTGASSLISYTLLFFFGFTMLQIRATLIIPWFVLSISSLVIFAHNNLIDYPKGIALMLGMALGGYLGSHLMIKKGNAWLVRLFVVIVLVSSLRLLFFS